MPSTPQSKYSKSSSDSSRDHAKLIRPETFLCRVKYENNLPDIPFDPKFRNQPVDSTRFVDYVPTSLERNHKLELLVGPNVGVDVDLIDQSSLMPNPDVPLHPTDAMLLEDEIPSAIAARRSKHSQSVSWLRKTEYISTEIYSQLNKGDKVESRLGSNFKRGLAEENVYRDRDSQIKAIEATFIATKKPIKKHYSKEGVVAVEEFPLLPDFRLWKYPCAQVIFDDNPARKNLTPEEQKEEVTQAMIRGMVDETGDQFVAYFLPTADTKKRRSVDQNGQILYTDGEEYEYELVREYNWNVKNKTMSNYEENYFFVFREDGAFYNELETRVKLSKRRKINPTTDPNSFWSKGPNTQNTLANKTRLVVTHREFTEDDIQAQKSRMYMLDHEIEEEDEEEDEAASEVDDEEGGNNDENQQSPDDENQEEQTREEGNPPTVVNESDKESSNSDSDSDIS